MCDAGGEISRVSRMFLTQRPRKRARGCQIELQRRCKRDKGQMAMARRVQQETTMSLKWIAQRMQIGGLTLHENY